MLPSGCASAWVRPWGGLISRVIPEIPVGLPRLLINLLVFVMLAACGGGGGENEDAPAGGFRVSGVIQTDALNAVDSDTNDPISTTVRNNNRGSAQVVLAPAIIGGYLAAPGTPSRFGFSADPWDFYQVELSAGQQIVLEFARLRGNFATDLDLFLVDREGTVVDASVGTGTIESLLVPADDTYFIGVEAVRGFANYLLRIESEPFPLADVPSRRLSADFVPGEIIVAPAVTHRTLAGEGTKVAEQPISIAADLGFQSVAGTADREQLWQIPEHQAVGTLATMGVELPSGLRHLRFSDPEQEQRYLTLTALRALHQQYGITGEPNHRVYPQQISSNDPLLGLQWHHRAIALPEAWTISRGTEREVIIAIVDTGVFLEHEDLRSRLVPGYDFIADPRTARDGDGIDPNPDDPGDSPFLGRSSWHGTHVAGIAAAHSNNATGVAGISWGARIMPVRVLGRGGGTAYDTLQGVRFAAGLPNDSGTVPARPADVINLSLGGGSFSAIEEELYRQIRARGIFVVAASGNEAGAISFPAAYADVFAVGATDAKNQRAPYSNFGPGLSLVAPGGDMRVDLTGDGFADGILSTFVDDSSGVRQPVYAFQQGTSMATPVVSGVIALGRALDPEIDPQWFAQALQAGRLTDDIGAAGWDPETGWGQINAWNTLLAVSERDGGTPLPTQLSVAPAQIDLGITGVEAEIAVRKLGPDPLKVTGVIADPSWLQIAPVSVNASGFGTYRIVAARSGLAPDSYSGSVQISADSGETVTVPVRLRVAEAGRPVDSVGTLYVLLLDGNEDTIQEVSAQPENGQYRFAFTEVPAGRYRIFAGTDMNHDLFICDPGEACGAYPTLLLFETVEITGNRDDLNFGVGFRARPITASAARGMPEPRPETGGGFARKPQ